MTILRLRKTRISVEISPSTRKSKARICFKRCALTWKYGVNESKQKWLAQKWTYGLLNLRKVVLCKISKQGNVHLIHYGLTMQQNVHFLGILVLVHPKPGFHQHMNQHMRPGTHAILVWLYQNDNSQGIFILVQPPTHLHQTEDFQGVLVLLQETSLNFLWCANALSSLLLCPCE